MIRDSVRVLDAGQVKMLSSGLEGQIIELVREAYAVHADGRTVLPYSTFLRFPAPSASRIIALPGYLDRDFDLAGMKWISSFPTNLDRGIDRASALIVLNSTETGRAYAMMEGSIISAKRTAASAALAASVICQSPPAEIGLIGCGPINFEVMRFLSIVFPSCLRAILLDVLPDRAACFAERLHADHVPWKIDVVTDIREVLDTCALVSIATTASAPHISELPKSGPRKAILHLSLRDIAPNEILQAENIVDDPNHVCREETSLHLAERLIGNRSFIRGTLGEILSGKLPARQESGTVAIFSPFGLGVLDLAVAELINRRAEDIDAGLVLRDFYPVAWNVRG